MGYPKSSNESSSSAPSAISADITAFLREYVAGMLDVPVGSVRVDRPLGEQGLPSVRAAELVGRLAMRLGRDIPGTVVWDHPTIAGLAAHLTGTGAAPGTARGDRPHPVTGGDPIAIVGIGCRLPGGIETPDALWQSLLDGVDAVREVPGDRWNADEWLDPDPGAPGKTTTRWGGFLDAIGEFDAELFRISPAEARNMDPQQRLALETAWASLEDARIAPGGLEGTRTGVFLGTMAQEYHLATGADAHSIETHSAVGWDNSIVAARIAYALGLRGPALVVATACSSSLTATHLAVRSLRAGESDLALAGGVNVMLHPNTTVAMTKFGGLNPEGQCRAFDADANGYVRAEGCGVLVLRRLSDALAAGERVYAVIRGTAINNDGASNGLTAPNPRAQAEVLRDAWQDAGISPREVAYVEAHGTGTPLGDPIEATALGEVFGPGRDEPLLLGSAKTNFGHLEPAAGVTGMMKTALALHHGALPANLHFDAPNPRIDFEAAKLRVVTEARPWPGDGVRRAGVSGFGFGGSNAHVALEEAPGRRGHLPEPDRDPDRDRDPGSGRTAGERPALALFFSGHGSQWLGMGRDLLAEPAFRTALADCDRALRPVLGWSVTDELLAGERHSRLDRTDVVQPVLFSVQVALARTLDAWGVRPDAVLGQSIGEVAAAVAAGALPLAEGARLIGVWSALIAERVSGHGGLIVCDLTPDEAVRLIADGGHALSVAGHLAPGQVCLSGPLDAIAAVERELAARGDGSADGTGSAGGTASARGTGSARVNIDYAAHSRELAALAPELGRRLGAVRTGTGTTPFWSTVTGTRLDAAGLDAAYWARNMSEPMLVRETVDALAAAHPGRPLRIVEIAPHPVARHSLERILSALRDRDRTDAAVLTLGRRDTPARRGIEALAAELWHDGFDIDLAAVAGRPGQPPLTAPLLLAVSGRSREALAENAGRLADRVAGAPDAELRDIAYSSTVTRSHLEHRAVAVAGTAEEAAEALTALAQGRPHPGAVEDESDEETGSWEGGTSVLFTGQGSQRAGMGRELYAAFPGYRDAFDAVCRALEPHLARPLPEIVFAPAESEDARLLHETEFTQPALFAFEVALYRLWESWGVRPQAVAGHSVGELSAAHVAGVLDLADAARLVAARGRLMQGCERGGAMASLEAGETEVLDALAGGGERVSIAALNSPRQTVISGDETAVTRVVEHFAGQGRRTRRLEVSHAFHSPHMDSMLAEYRRVAEGCTFRAPVVPLLSTVTGTWSGQDERADPETAHEPDPDLDLTTPAYWVRQVRAAVRFADAVAALEAAGIERHLECGPAAVLSAMGVACTEREVGFVPSQRAGKQPDEVRDLLRALAELHVSGQPLDWEQVFAGTGATPTDLPGYAFQRRHHWIEPPTRTDTGPAERALADDSLWQAVDSGEIERICQLLGTPDTSAVATLLPHLAAWRGRQERADALADCHYEETWQPGAPSGVAPDLTGHWILATPAGPTGTPLANAVADALAAAGGTVHTLPAADDRAGYAAALTALTATPGTRTPRAVLALTPLDEDPHPDRPAVTSGAALTLALTQALGDAGVRAPLRILTRGAVRTGETDTAPRPAGALAWGLGHVIALEHTERWGGLVDLPAATATATADEEHTAPGPLDTATARHLLTTLAEQPPTGEEYVALRPAGRLVRRLRRAAPAPYQPWRARGTVLVTGGSGALAGHLAVHLAERGAEHVVLASRRGPAAEGAAALAARTEAAGARVTLASCDITNRAELERLFADIDRDAAPLRAVFHAAGSLDDRLLDRLDPEALATTAAPKLQAATHLHELTKDRELDAFVLYSSVIGTLGNIGQANYAMANAALDALAELRRAEGLPAVSIAWGPWADGGMTHGAAESQLRRIGLVPMAPDVALAALDTALAPGTGTGTASRVLARIDWPRAVSAYNGTRTRPFLQDIPEARAAFEDAGSAPDARTGADARAGGGNPLRAALIDIAEGDREAHLRSLLAVEAAAVLGVRDPASLSAERGFKDLGFDSMMAIQLSGRVQQRTGVATPKTLIYDHPTLAAAARWLLDDLMPASETSASEPFESEGPARGTGAVTGGRRHDEPLAIVGVGLRMPGDADDLESLWHVLAEGRDTVREIPADRFDADAYYDPAPDSEGMTYVRHASFLDDVTSFDAAFFGVSPREAEPMDPQHRLLLETAWHSLENAGIRPGDLRDTRTGVFVGAGVGEYGAHRGGGTHDTYTLTGSLPSFNAGRLSYHLGLQGPALSVDTACSSSLVALHLACEAIRNGECDIALAGGVQVLADPGAFVALSRSHALAPDGRSKTFSAEADGYGRGEGVGVVVVMRLSEALAGDREILGVIRASAVNHDGASSGITAPNGTSQQKVIRAALSSAGLSPTDIDYVECHGTGTPLGDPIEVQALAAVYGEGRDPEDALRLGTAKTVIGHLESAAGIAGVCKMLAAFQHDALPPTLRSSPRNPNIDWDGLPVTVVDELSAWERDGVRPRRAGVSSFGLSGTNAHVVLEESPVREVAVEVAAGVEGPVPVPVVLSGRDEGAVREQAGRWASWLAARAEVSLADVAVTAARHRTHFESRASVVAADMAELVEGLRAVAEGREAGNVVSGVAERRGKTVFVFPGQGSQWAGMGRELLASSEVFAGVVEACDAALRPLTGWSVRAVLAGEESEGLPPVDRVDVVQPALFAMGVGLAAVWRSLGVEPAAVVGHSQGEVVAAVVSGALSLEQGALVVASRSQAVLACAGLGGMALVERPLAVVEGFLAPFGEALSVAAVNTAGSTIISGRADAIDRIVSDLQEREIYARKIKVDYASHNAQMDPLLPGLAEKFTGLTAVRPEVPFYSTVTGETAAGGDLDGGYWCRNLREPVRFDRALERLLGDGHTVFVEISAHPVLSMPLTDGSAEHGGIVVGSLARDRGGMDQLLRNLGLLHVQGQALDWTRVLGHGDVLPLPAYAFQRERYWLEVPRSSGDAGALGLEVSAHPWLGAATALADGEGHLLTGRLSLAEQPWLKDHAVFGTVLVPGTGLLELATAAAQQVGAAGVAELTLAEPLVLEEDVRLQVLVGASDNGLRTLTVHSRPSAVSGTWTCHATGLLTDAAESATSDAEGFAELTRWPVAGAERVDLDGFLDRFQERGIAYGPAFQGLTELWRKGDTAYGLVRLPAPENGGEYGVHPALLDAALHVMEGTTDSARSGAPNADPAAGPRGALLPFEWSDVELLAVGSGELRVRIDVTEAEDHGRRIAVWATDPTGRPVVRVGALHLRRARAEQIRAARGTDDLYQLRYQPVDPPDAGTVRASADAVLGGTGELAALLSAVALPGTEALASLLDADPSTRPGRVVIDLTAPGDGAAADSPRAAHEAAGAALVQLQTLVADERLDAADIVWVTRDSTAATDGDRLAGLANAPLTGLLRTARAEHPERSLRLIDLGPGPGGIDPRLLARALAATGEPELAVREGQVLAARLTTERTDAAGTARPLDPEGTVLLTGGTGELGRAVALHLVRHHGVRHLVLTSRRGVEAPGAERLMEELREEGALWVRVVTCDVGRRDDLAKVLALAEENRPWTAVLHLAGVLDDGVLLGQDTERLDRAMTPKVDGAFQLEELTRDLDLAAFVVFSSAAGTLGTAGQSIYAAANTWLDAFAVRRRAEGRPVTSLAWGLWQQAGVGMTSHLGGAELARMRRQGIAPLPFDHGLRLLDAVLARPADNFVPVRLDLRQIQRDADADRAVPALLRGLVRAATRRAGAATADSAGSLRDRLLATPAPEQRDLVTEMVLREVAAVLGLDSAGALSPDQVLKELGLDSLMAVELRRRLALETGLSLPATLAFDYPAPVRIAQLVLDRMELPVEEPVREPGQAGDTGADDDAESRLSWALTRLSADRLHHSGLLQSLVDLARQPAAEGGGRADGPAPLAGIGADARPVAERSVDEINAELNAFLEASGLG
ncbi:SDR family NAD(P)-dependent oxidoreductase [Streptomyces sp. NPDC057137]|uniref:SDR family NAD(P)-dependent oxidoreductase n=1 Tax=Streptomyces sp. NPDC057137 TaxID=3346030 RepID=UPI003635C099